MSANEWIIHDGGPMPVSAETLVHVRLEDGDDDTDTPPAPAYYWSDEVIECCSWQCRNGSDGIVAYRIFS